MPPAAGGIFSCNIDPDQCAGGSHGVGHGQGFRKGPFGRTTYEPKNFLLTLGTAGAALAAPGPAERLWARDAKTADEPLATLLDLSKCVGCGACAEACREAHQADYPEPEKPFPKMYPSRVKAEDFSASRDVDDRLTPYNWLFIQTATVKRTAGN